MYDFLLGFLNGLSLGLLTMLIIWMIKESEY